MKQKMKQWLGALLSIALILGLMPGMSLTAYAANETYTKLMNDKTVVKFNNHDWYIIADDSTATGGTVTLLAADTSFGTSKFHDSSSAYSGSTVKGVLDALTAEGGAFAGVKDAIVNTDLTDVGVDGAKLYLLSTSEAQALSPDVLKMNFSSDMGVWWLRSAGFIDGFAACVFGESGNVDDNGINVFGEVGVRPALKLDLSKVVFDSATKTFSLLVSYPLWVGGVQVTSANKNDVLGSADEGATVTYTPAAGTTPAALTLNNANITKGYPASPSTEKSGIYYEGADALEIKLAEGSVNKIEKSSDDFGYGIHSSGANAAVTISGTGTLTVKGSDYGIVSAKNVTINGGNVSVEVLASGISAANDVTIIGGTVSAASTISGGHGIIGGNNVTIEDGDVTASATGDDSDGIKAYSGFVTISGGKVVASGKTQAIIGKVKNSITGIGWMDTAGTEGEAAIAVSAEGQSLTYKKVQFSKVKDPATVTENPKPNTLTYTGTAQELVTAGTATGGEMQYALGTKDAATQPYTTSIPTATEAGTYYVWYKAVGDDDHSDSEPACVEVTINGSVATIVEQKENTPNAEVEGFDDELVSDVMNDVEKDKVKAGEKATLTLEMTNIDSSVPQEDKKLTENLIAAESSKAKVGMFLDLSIWLRIGSDLSRQITSTGAKKITVKVEVPENLRAPAGVTRKFFFIHIHNGVAKKIAETTSTTIPLTFNELSTFALAYEDVDADADADAGFYSGLKISQKNGKIKVSWDKGEGAAKYAVFATYCGKKYSSKPVKNTKSTSVTIKKINNKKIDFTKNIKIYVAAYDSAGKLIGNTVSAHISGMDNKEYKNVKSLKLSTKAITVGTGQTSKIKASVKLEKGKKKELSDEHAEKFRYRSTNTNVATVDKNGKVTGVSAGTCDVYVYARNGLAKKVTVTVW